MVIEEIPVEKDENEKFNVIMFDNALNITWKKYSIAISEYTVQNK